MCEIFNMKTLKSTVMSSGKILIILIFANLRAADGFSFRSFSDCVPVEKDMPSSLRGGDCSWSGFSTETQDEDQESAIVNVDARLLFKSDREPNLVVTICTYAPDQSRNFDIMITRPGYVSTVFCGKFTSTGSQSIEKVNKTFTFEFECTRSIETDQIFTVSVSGEQGDRMSTKLTVPDCKDKQMMQTHQCKEYRKKYLFYKIEQVGHDEVTATLARSTYNKSFNSKLHFAIKYEIPNFWLRWGPPQQHQILAEPNYTAVFSNLRRGVQYRIIAWRENEMMRYSKNVILTVPKKKIIMKYNKRIAEK